MDHSKNKENVRNKLQKIEKERSTGKKEVPKCKYMRLIKNRNEKERTKDRMKNRERKNEVSNWKSSKNEKKKIKKKKEKEWIKSVKSKARNIEGENSLKVGIIKITKKKRKRSLKL